MYRQHQQVSDSRYHYDPLGRRIRKSVTRHDPQTATSYTKSTDFLWQGLRLLSETHHRSEQPDITRVYCYEQNSYAPLARIDTTGDDPNTPQVYYFHTDVTGTPKEVTDTAGQIVWQADYTAWGEIDLYRAHQIDQPLRFQGQYADDETGLYYTTFRYYDPHAGRFTTQDPIGLAGGWNLYQYAPNPTGWVDPWGLTCTHIAKNPKQAYAAIKDKWGYKMTKRDMRELQNTVDRIKAHSPRYSNDGTTFRNSHTEGNPNSQRLNTGSGPYKEWTVKTPDVGNNGARRIVIDSKTREAYYSHDHYDSFIKIDLNGWK